MPDTTSSDPDFERQKWHADLDLRKREIDLKEREQRNRDAEIELRKAEQSKSGWASPLAVAIFAAAIAASGNAVVTVVNGRLQRDLETQKSRAEIELERTKAESNRILEMIKTGDEEKAAANLGFLLKSGLVADPALAAKLGDYLEHRTPGSGPALPSPAGRVSFEQSGALTHPLQDSLQKLFDDYFTYLDKIGFPPAKQKVNVKVDASAGGAAYYFSNTIVVDPILADDPSVPLHEYNHHILWGESQERQWSTPFGAVEYGLAAYFACSF